MTSRKKGQLICFFILTVTVFVAVFVVTMDISYGKSSDAVFVQRRPASLVTTYAGNPKTSRAFTWYTDTSIENSVVQLVEAPYYQDATSLEGKNAIMVKGVFYALQTETDSTSTRNIHKVHVQGLKSGCTYYYRAGDGDKNWSHVYKFKTEPSDKKSFTFLNFTDSQYYYETYMRVMEEATKRYPNAAFVLHSGDYIEYGLAWEYDKVSQLMESWEATLPLMMTPGNHDLVRDSDNNQLEEGIASAEALYKARYQFPDNGPENQKQFAYSFEYGDAYFAVLNNGIDGYDGCKDQLEWLKEDARNSKKTWKIVSVHYGPYGIDAILNKELVKTLEAVGIDLVLFGHDHKLLRSNAIKDDIIGKSKVVDGTYYSLSQGVVYYSSGRASGPSKSSVPGENCNFSLYTNPTNAPTYGAITVSKDQLTIETRSSLDDPQTIETFVIAKAEACEHKAHKVALSKTRVAYTGKKINKEQLPKVTVKDSKGKIISSKYYTVNLPKYVKNIGKYPCKVTFKGSCTEYAGTKTVYFEVVPTAKPKIKKIISGKKSITINWNAVKKEKKSQVTGYDLRVSTDKNFKKKVKIISVKGYNQSKVKIAKLQPNKKYYIQIRTFKVTKGEKICSTWSSAKTCKTKKG